MGLVVRWEIVEEKTWEEKWIQALDDSLVTDLIDSLASKLDVMMATMRQVLL